MKFAIQIVTVEMASAWLERMLSFNRKPRPSIVDRYAADMLSRELEE
ncbi:MAG: hypothetical protein MZW92_31230 [Comamonadaceae bacterium]|nr:hypothetical protein [Comamonadaceae bacterium]